MGLGIDRNSREHALVQSAALICALLAAAGLPRSPAPGTRIAVQPFEGASGPALRSQVAKLLQSKRFKVVTSLPKVSGTAQYPIIARERRIAGFVVTSAEERRTRHIITFMVWNGRTGGVQAEWTVSGPPRKIAQLVAKGFWQHLGRALIEVKAPPSEKLAPAPPMRIYAGEGPN